MNSFAEQYKTYSDAALLDILDHPADYLPEALAAAQAELQGRNLSEQAIADAREENLASQQAKQQSQARVTEASTKAKSLLATFLDTLNPIQSAAPTAERWARWLSIAFVLIAIAAWYENFWLAVYMLAEIGRGWDFSVLEFYLPLLLLPLGALLFTLRKRLGWHLMAAYLAYSIPYTAGLIVLAWNWKSSGATALDELFPQPSLWTLGLATLLFVCLLWAVARQSVRALFNVTPKAAVSTIATFGVLTALVVANHLLT